MAFSLFPNFTTPGFVCSCCGSAQRGSEAVCDTGMFITALEFQGRVQICETCIVDVAHQLGMLDLDQSTALKAQTFQAEAARARAEAELAKALVAAKALDDYLVYRSGMTVEAEAGVN